MATITLTADANYSALTVANDDTIELAGFELTIDVQPSETGITVQTPGTAGTMSIGGAFDLSTWSATAGTTTLISAVPTGASIASVSGGSASNARGVNENRGTVTTATGGPASNAQGVNSNIGTVTTATGGSASGANGVNFNIGTVTTATGGSASNARGVNENRGTVTTATGGPASGANGVNSNNGTVTTATGGSASGAHGVSVNNGTVTTATGGSVSGANGVNFNNGTVLGAVDDIERAVNLFRGSLAIVSGPDFQSEIVMRYNALETLYVINGPLHPDAVIPDNPTIINSYDTGGGSTGYPRSRVANA